MLGVRDTVNSNGKGCQFTLDSVDCVLQCNNLPQMNKHEIIIAVPPQAFDHACNSADPFLQPFKAVAVIQALLYLRIKLRSRPHLELPRHMCALCSLNRIGIKNTHEENKII